MIELNIPGSGLISLTHIVFDVNGTLAIDGQLLDGIARKIHVLSDRLAVHLLTADTHGYQDQIDRQLGLTAVRVAKGRESEQKAAFVEQLGTEKTIAVGQGANDAGMLKAAAIGICVISPEGTAIEAVLAADVIVPDIYAAFDLLEHPLRLVATMRR